MDLKLVAPAFLPVIGRGTPRPIQVCKPVTRIEDYLDPTQAGMPVPPTQATAPSLRLLHDLWATAKFLPQQRFDRAIPSEASGSCHASHAPHTPRAPSRPCLSR